MKTFQNFLNKLNNIFVKLFPYCVGVAVGMLIVSCRIPAIIKEYHDYSNHQLSISLQPHVSKLNESEILNYNNELKNIEEYVCNKENEIK